MHKIESIFICLTISLLLATAYICHYDRRVALIESEIECLKAMNDKNNKDSMKLHRANSRSLTAIIDTLKQER